MSETKFAHEWVARRDSDDLYCRMCGVLKWKTGTEMQPPCDGEEVRIVDGNPIIVVKKPDAQA